MKYSKRFKKDYNKIFKKDPVSANMMLLFMDLADKNGQIKLPDGHGDLAEQITVLMNARFNDPMEYQL